MKDRDRKGRGINPPKLFGNKYAAKLTEEDVINIRKDSRDDTTVGKDYGISRSAVNMIKNRKRWTNF